MATVKQHFKALSGEPGSSAFPQLKRAGTNFPVSGYYFDASVEEKLYFYFKAINYGSGNITTNIQWYADSASSGDVRWGVKLAAITPNTDTGSIESKSFGTQQTVDDTHLGTTGKRLHECTITVSNLDSIASGDYACLEVSRPVLSGMTGDAVLTGVEITYSDT